MSSERDAPRTIPGIDALRVIAMAFVANQNLWSFDLVTRRWDAVLTPREALLIFVGISGFCLTRELLARPRPWRTWLGHRLFMLYSMYWTVVLTTIAWHRLLGAKYDLVWILWPMTGLQGLLESTKYWIAGPWWFVALLLQIYAIFPLVFVAVRRAPWTMLLVAACVTLASDLWHPLRIVGVGHSVDGYLVTLVAGSCLAAVDARRLPRRAVALAGIAGAVAYVLLSQAPTDGPTQPYRAMAAALTLLAFFECVWMPQLLVRAGPFVFAFFLAHQGGMQIVTRLPDGDWRVFGWLLISIGFAWVYTRGVGVLRDHLAPILDPYRRTGAAAPAAPDGR